jgi:hypothetical protein
MKYSHALSSLALLGLAASTSCSQEDLTDDGTGGTGTGATSGSGQMMTVGGAGGTTGGTGGTTGGTGGASATGGAGGSGGTAGSGVMMSGAPGVGGTAGSAGGGVSSGGMATTGGSAGTGTSVGGSAGAPPIAGAGGTDPGAGGMGGTGMAGTGTAGSGMAGTGSGALDPAVIVPEVDGFYWEGTCKATAENHNCLITSGACPSGADYYHTGVTLTKSIKVHGTPGTKYTLNIEVRGVAGGRCYTGGTPGTTDKADLYQNTNNGWYAGGQQLNDSIWNTYEIHVENPAVDGAPNVYFANSVQAIADPDAFPSGTGNNCQMEMTIGYAYTASFPVMGDSTIRFDVHDSNCKGQQNCGHTAQTEVCQTGARTVSLAGMSPAATFSQPVTNTVGTATLYPQWLYFDVKSITSP